MGHTKEYYKAWRAANPEKRREYQDKRYAKLGATRRPKKRCPVCDTILRERREHSIESCKRAAAKNFYTSFSRDVKAYMTEKGASAIEAVLDVAQIRKIDMTEAGALVDAELKEMIAVEGLALKMLKRDET